MSELATAATLAAMRAYLAKSGQRNIPVAMGNQDLAFEGPWVVPQRKGDEAAMARVAEEYHESLHLDIRHHEETGDKLCGRRVAQVLLLFFFYGYGAHRDLHSFPTRRSSDLRSRSATPRDIRSRTLRCGYAPAPACMLRGRPRLTRSASCLRAASRSRI